MFLVSWIQYWITRLCVDLLRPWLEPYIDSKCLSGETFQVGPTSFTLRNVEFRVQDFLDSNFPGLAASVPVRVNTFALKHFELWFSWTQLFSTPISVSIEGVNILLAPKTAAPNSDESCRYKLWLLNTAISNVVAFFNEEFPDPKNDSAASKKDERSTTGVTEGEAMGSWVKRAIRFLSDALQITVSDVHLRLEWINPETPRRPFSDSDNLCTHCDAAFGLGLQKLCIKSIDSLENPADGHEEWRHLHTAESSLIRKRIGLQNVTVYMDTEKPECVYHTKLKVEEKNTDFSYSYHERMSLSLTTDTQKIMVGEPDVQTGPAEKRDITSSLRQYMVLPFDINTKFVYHDQGKLPDSELLHLLELNLPELWEEELLSRLPFTTTGFSGQNDDWDRFLENPRRFLLSIWRKAKTEIPVDPGQGPVTQWFQENELSSPDLLELAFKFENSIKECQPSIQVEVQMNAVKLRFSNRQVSTLLQLGNVIMERLDSLYHNVDEYDDSIRRKLHIPSFKTLHTWKDRGSWSAFDEREVSHFLSAHSRHLEAYQNIWCKYLNGMSLSTEELRTLLLLETYWLMMPNVLEQWKERRSAGGTNVISKGVELLGAGSAVPAHCRMVAGDHTYRKQNKVLTWVKSLIGYGKGKDAPALGSKDRRPKSVGELLSLTKTSILEDEFQQASIHLSKAVDQNSLNGIRNALKDFIEKSNGSKQSIGYYHARYLGSVYEKRAFLSSLVNIGFTSIEVVADTPRQSQGTYSHPRLLTKLLASDFRLKVDLQLAKKVYDEEPMVHKLARAEGLYEVLRDGCNNSAPWEISGEKASILRNSFNNLKHLQPTCSGALSLGSVTMYDCSSLHSGDEPVLLPVLSRTKTKSMLMQNIAGVFDPIGKKTPLTSAPIVQLFLGYDSFSDKFGVSLGLGKLDIRIPLLLMEWVATFLKTVPVQDSRNEEEISWALKTLSVKMVEHQKSGLYSVKDPLSVEKYIQKVAPLLEVDLSIACPRIILPSILRSKAAPLILIDLGHLTTHCTWSRLSTSKKGLQRFSLLDEDSYRLLRANIDNVHISIGYSSVVGPLIMDVKSLDLRSEISSKIHTHFFDESNFLLTPVRVCFEFGVRQSKTGADKFPLFDTQLFVSKCQGVISDAKMKAMLLFSDAISDTVEKLGQLSNADASSTSQPLREESDCSESPAATLRDYLLRSNNTKFLSLRLFVEEFNLWTCRSSRDTLKKVEAIQKHARSGTSGAVVRAFVLPTSQDSGKCLPFVVQLLKDKRKAVVFRRLCAALTPEIVIPSRTQYPADMHLPSKGTRSVKSSIRRSGNTVVMCAKSSGALRVFDNTHLGRVLGKGCLPLARLKVGDIRLASELDTDHSATSFSCGYFNIQDFWRIQQSGWGVCLSYLSEALEHPPVGTLNELPPLPPHPFEYCMMFSSHPESTFFSLNVVLALGDAPQMHAACKGSLADISLVVNRDTIAETIELFNLKGGETIEHTGKTPSVDNTDAEEWKSMFVSGGSLVQRGGSGLPTIDFQLECGSIDLTLNSELEPCSDDVKLDFSGVPHSMKETLPSWALPGNKLNDRIALATTQCIGSFFDLLPSSSLQGQQYHSRPLSEASHLVDFGFGSCHPYGYFYRGPVAHIVVANPRLSIGVKHSEILGSNGESVSSFLMGLSVQSFALRDLTCEMGQGGLGDSSRHSSLCQLASNSQESTYKKIRTKSRRASRKHVEIIGDRRVWHAAALSACRNAIGPNSELPSVPEKVKDAIVPGVTLLRSLSTGDARMLSLSKGSVLFENATLHNIFGILHEQRCVFGSYRRLKSVENALSWIGSDDFQLESATDACQERVLPHHDPFLYASIAYDISSLVGSNSQSQPTRLPMALETDLKIANVRCIYLQKFINEILDFFYAGPFAYFFEGEQAIASNDKCDPGVMSICPLPLVSLNLQDVQTLAPFQSADIQSIICDVRSITIQNRPMLRNSDISDAVDNTDTVKEIEAFISHLKWFESWTWHYRDLEDEDAICFTPLSSGEVALQTYRLNISLDKIKLYTALRPASKESQQIARLQQVYLLLSMIPPGSLWSASTSTRALNMLKGILSSPRLVLEDFTSLDNIDISCSLGLPCVPGCAQSGLTFGDEGTYSGSMDVLNSPMTFALSMSPVHAYVSQLQYLALMHFTYLNVYESATTIPEAFIVAKYYASSSTSAIAYAARGLASFFRADKIAQDGLNPAVKKLLQTLLPMGELPSKEGQAYFLLSLFMRVGALTACEGDRGVPWTAESIDITTKDGNGYAFDLGRAFARRELFPKLIASATVWGVQYGMSLSISEMPLLLRIAGVVIDDATDRKVYADEIGGFKARSHGVTYCEKDKSSSEAISVHPCFRRLLYVESEQKQLDEMSLADMHLDIHDEVINVGTSTGVCLQPGGITFAMYSGPRKFELYKPLEKSSAHAISTQEIIPSCVYTWEISTADVTMVVSPVIWKLISWSLPPSEYGSSKYIGATCIKSNAASCAEVASWHYWSSLGHLLRTQNIDGDPKNYSSQWEEDIGTSGLTAIEDTGALPIQGDLITPNVLQNYRPLVQQGGYATHMRVETGQTRVFVVADISDPLSDALAVNCKTKSYVDLNPAGEMGILSDVYDLRMYRTSTRLCEDANKYNCVLEGSNPLSAYGIHDLRTDATSLESMFHATNYSPHIGGENSFSGYSLMHPISITAYYFYRSGAFIDPCDYGSEGTRDVSGSVSLVPSGLSGTASTLDSIRIEAGLCDVKVVLSCLEYLVYGQEESLSQGFHPISPSDLLKRETTKDRSNADTSGFQVEGMLEELTNEQGMDISRISDDAWEVLSKSLLQKTRDSKELTNKQKSALRSYHYLYPENRRCFCSRSECETAMFGAAVAYLASRACTQKIDWLRPDEAVDCVRKEYLRCRSQTGPVFSLVSAIPDPITGYFPETSPQTLSLRVPGVEVDLVWYIYSQAAEYAALSATTTSMIDRTVEDPEVLKSSVAVFFPHVSFEVVNDLEGRYVPLIRFQVDKVGSSMISYHYGSRMLAEASVTISADYFNPVVDAWEPFLEEWSVRLEYASPEPLSMNNSVGKSASEYARVFGVERAKGIIQQAKRGEIPIGIHPQIVNRLFLEQMAENNIWDQTTDERGNESHPLRLSLGSSLYALEDVIVGSTDQDFNPSSVNSPIFAAFREALREQFGNSNKDDTSNFKTGESSQTVPSNHPEWGKTCLPGEGWWLEDYEGVKENQVPSDMFLRIVSNRELNINLSVALTNNILQSYSLFERTMTEQSKSRRTATLNRGYDLGRRIARIKKASTESKGIEIRNELEIPVTLSFGNPESLRSHFQQLRQEFCSITRRTVLLAEVEPFTGLGGEMKADICLHGRKIIKDDSFSKPSSTLIYQNIGELSFSADECYPLLSQHFSLLIAFVHATRKFESNFALLIIRQRYQFLKCWGWKCPEAVLNGNFLSVGQECVDQLKDSENQKWNSYGREAIHAIVEKGFLPTSLGLFILSKVGTVSITNESNPFDEIACRVTGSGTAWAAHFGGTLDFHFPDVSPFPSASASHVEAMTTDEVCKHTRRKQLDVCHLGVSSWATPSNLTTTLYGGCWRGVKVAGPVLKYSFAKDKWRRQYAAIFGSSIFIFPGEKPKPYPDPAELKDTNREFPVWVTNTAIRKAADLSSGDIVVSSKVLDPLCRPPTPFVLEFRSRLTASQLYAIGGNDDDDDVDENDTRKAKWIGPGRDVGDHHVELTLGFSSFQEMQAWEASVLYILDTQVSSPCISRPLPFWYPQKRLLSNDRDLVPFSWIEWYSARLNMNGRDLNCVTKSESLPCIPFSDVHISAETMQVPGLDVRNRFSTQQQIGQTFLSLAELAMFIYGSAFLVPSFKPRHFVVRKQHMSTEKEMYKNANRPSTSSYGLVSINAGLREQVRSHIKGSSLGDASRQALWLCISDLHPAYFVVNTDIVAPYYVPQSNPFISALTDSDLLSDLTHRFELLCKDSSTVAGRGTRAETYPLYLSSDAQLAARVTNALKGNIVHAVGEGLMVDVKYLSGLKTLQIRSTVAVHNYCALPMELMYEVPDLKNEIWQILPGEEKFAPLQAVLNGKIRFRPAVATADMGDHSPSPYIWSGSIDLDKVQRLRGAKQTEEGVVNEHNKRKTPTPLGLTYSFCCADEQGQSTNQLFSFAVHIWRRSLVSDEKAANLAQSSVNDYFTTRIGIFPSLRLENLLPFPLRVRCISREKMTVNDELAKLHSLLDTEPKLSDVDSQMVETRGIDRSAIIGERLLQPGDKQDVMKLILSNEDYKTRNQNTKIQGERDLDAVEGDVFHLIDAVAISIKVEGTDILESLPWSEVAQTPGSRVLGFGSDCRSLPIFPQYCFKKMTSDSTTVVTLPYSTTLPLHVQCERRFIGESTGFISPIESIGATSAKASQNVRARLHALACQACHIKFYVPVWGMNCCTFPLSYGVGDTKKDAAGMLLPLQRAVQHILEKRTGKEDTRNALALLDRFRNEGSTGSMFQRPTYETISGHFELISFDPATPSEDYNVRIKSWKRSSWSDSIPVSQVYDGVTSFSCEETPSAMEDFSPYEPLGVLGPCGVRLTRTLQPYDKINQKVKDLTHTFHLGVKVQIAPHNFFRSKVLKFKNRYNIINNSKANVLIRQGFNGYVRAVPTDVHLIPAIKSAQSEAYAARVAKTSDLTSRRRQIKLEGAEPAESEVVARRDYSYSDQSEGGAAFDGFHSKFAESIPPINYYQSGNELASSLSREGSTSSGVVASPKFRQDRRRPHKDFERTNESERHEGYNEKSKESQPDKHNVTPWYPFYFQELRNYDSSLSPRSSLKIRIDGFPAITGPLWSHDVSKLIHVASAINVDAVHGVSNSRARLSTGRWQPGEGTLRGMAASMDGNITAGMARTVLNMTNRHACMRFLHPDQRSKKEGNVLVANTAPDVHSSSLLREISNLLLSFFPTTYPSPDNALSDEYIYSYLFPSDKSVYRDSAKYSLPALLRHQREFMELIMGHGWDRQEQWEWSSEFISDPGEFSLKLRKKLNGPHAPSPNVRVGKEDFYRLLPVVHELNNRLHGVKDNKTLSPSIMQDVDRVCAVNDSEKWSNDNKSEAIFDGEELRASSAQKRSEHSTLVEDLVSLPVSRNELSFCSSFINNAMGCSPSQVCWVSVKSTEGDTSTNVTIAPHPFCVQRNRRYEPYRIENTCSIDSVMIRQKGRGPAVAERVPCEGGRAVDGLSSIPYALDSPGAGSKAIGSHVQASRSGESGSCIMLQVRPVGIASLFYYNNGEVGMELSRRDFKKAVEHLIKSSLGGEEAGVAENRIQRVHSPNTRGSKVASVYQGISSFTGINQRSCQASEEGGQKGWGNYLSSKIASTEVKCDAIGDSAVTWAGDISGTFKERNTGLKGKEAKKEWSKAALGEEGALARRIKTEVFADPSNGATKVIKISDMPKKKAHQVSHLKQRIHELEDHLAMIEEVSKVLNEERDNETNLLVDEAATKGADYSGNASNRTRKYHMSRIPVETPFVVSAATKDVMVHRNSVKLKAVGGRNICRSSYNDGTNVNKEETRKTDLLAIERLQSDLDDIYCSQVGKALESQFYNFRDYYEIPVDPKSETTANESDSWIKLNWPGNAPTNFDEVKSEEMLWIQLVSAAGLPAADVSHVFGGGESDPYVKLTIPQLFDEPALTSHCPNTLDPVWGEQFVFYVHDKLVSKGIKLVAQLWDYDKAGRDDSLGCVEIPLSYLRHDVLVDRWYPLEYMKGSHLRACGSLRVRMMRTSNLRLQQIQAAQETVSIAVSESILLRRKLIRHLAMLQKRSQTTAETAMEQIDDMCSELSEDQPEESVGERTDSNKDTRGHESKLSESSDISQDTSDDEERELDDIADRQYRPKSAHPMISSIASGTARASGVVGAASETSGVRQLRNRQTAGEDPTMWKRKRAKVKKYQPTAVFGKSAAGTGEWSFEGSMEPKAQFDAVEEDFEFDGGDSSSSSSSMSDSSGVASWEGQMEAQDPLPEYAGESLFMSEGSVAASHEALDAAKRINEGMYSSENQKEQKWRVVGHQLQTTVVEVQGISPVTSKIAEIVRDELSRRTGNAVSENITIGEDSKLKELSGDQLRETLQTLEGQRLYAVSRVAHNYHRTNVSDVTWDISFSSVNHGMTFKKATHTPAQLNQAWWADFAHQRRNRSRSGFRFRSFGGDSREYRSQLGSLIIQNRQHRLTNNQSSAAQLSGSLFEEDAEDDDDIIQRSTTTAEVVKRDELESFSPNLEDLFPEQRLHLEVADVNPDMFAHAATLLHRSGQAVSRTSIPMEAVFSTLQGSLISHVNGVSLKGLSYEDSVNFICSTFEEASVNQPAVLRFTPAGPISTLYSSRFSDSSESNIPAEDYNPETFVMSPDSVLYNEVTEWGNRVPPPSANSRINTSNDSLPHGPHMVFELFARSGNSFASKELVKESEFSDFFVDKEAAAHQAESSSTPLLYFFGSNTALAASRRVVSGCYDREDVPLAHRSFIPLPAQGQKIDKWFALTPATEVWNDLRSRKIAPPRVRVVAQWVPLYAPKNAVKAMRLESRLKGTGISIMDHHPRELIYSTIRGLDIKADMNYDDVFKVKLDLARFQVDSQIPAAIYPTVIGRKVADSSETPVLMDEDGDPVPSKRKDKGKDKQSEDSDAYIRQLTQTLPVVSVRVQLVTHSTLIYLKEVSARLMRLNVAIDDFLLSALLELITNLDFTSLTGSNYMQDYSSLLQEHWEAMSFAHTQPSLTNADELFNVSHIDGYLVREICQNSHVSVLLEAPKPANTEITDKIYIQAMTLHPMFFDVTFSIGDDIEFLKSMIPDIPILGGLKNIISGLGSMLLNVDGAPIQVSSLVATHVFEDVDALTHRLLMFYVSNVLRGFYKIAGSASFLGNPVGLLSNVGSDVVAILYEPARGLLEGDTAASAMKSVSSSALSLISNTTVGVFDSGGKLLQTLAKGIRAIDFEKYGDPVFQRKYAAIIGPVSSRGPKHLGEGFFVGAKAFSLSLYKGFTGIVTTPYRGARKDGPIGFAKGLGMGVAGLVLKPTSGLLDLGVLSLRGVGSTVAAASSVLAGGDQQTYAGFRVRLPRFTGLYGAGGEKPLILQYNSREAEGYARLVLLQASGEAKGEHYRYHVPVYGMLKYKRYPAGHALQVCGELSSFYEKEKRLDKPSEDNEPSGNHRRTDKEEDDSFVRQTTISTPAFGGIQMKIRKHPPGANSDSSHRHRQQRQIGISGSSEISSFHQVREIGFMNRLRDRLTVTPLLLHTKEEGPRFWYHTQKGYLPNRQRQKPLECKFILLITSHSAYILHARTNRIYWRAVLHERTQKGFTAVGSNRARCEVFWHKHALGITDHKRKTGRALLIGPAALTTIATEALQHAISSIPDRVYLRNREIELSKDKEAETRQEREDAATLERTLQLQESLRRERRRTLLLRVDSVQFDTECLVPVERVKLDNFDHVREVMRQTNMVTSSNRELSLGVVNTQVDDDNAERISAFKIVVEHVPVTVPVKDNRSPDGEEFKTFSPSFSVYRTSEQFRRLLNLIPRKWQVMLCSSSHPNLARKEDMEEKLVRLLQHLQRELLLQSKGNASTLNPNDLLTLRVGLERFLGLV